MEIKQFDYIRLWERYVKGLNERITKEANKLAIQQAEIEHTNLWDICERYIPCINLEIEDIVRPNDNTERYRFESDFTITLTPRKDEKDSNENSTVDVG